MKTCCTCKKEFPATKEFFYKNKKTNDGFLYRCKKCQKESTKKRAIENPEYYKEWRKENPEKRNKIVRKHRHSNPNIKITQNNRSAIRDALKGKTKKCSRAEYLLGCSISEYKEYLSNKFTKGMSWDNYGKKCWHIDHIIPTSSFDLTDPEQEKQCFHYSNTQPLWAIDNVRKSNFILN